MNVMDIDATKRLAIAVVIQAVRDWRLLCQGKTAGGSNFAELEQFFKYDAEMYLQGTEMRADKLYQIMLVERARSPKHKREVIDGQASIKAVSSDHSRD